MSKSNYLENAILNLLFRATAIANIADNAAGAPLTDLYWALHTADPGDTGSQASFEASYGSYARVAVARGAGMSASVAGSTSPVSNVVFPVAATPALPTVQTLTHFSIGIASAGATEILYSGSLTPIVNVSAGVQVVLTTASTITED